MLNARGVGLDGEKGRPESLDVRIDAEAPALDIRVQDAPPRDGAPAAVLVTVTASDATGVARLEARVGDGEFAEFAGPLRIDADRDRKVCVRAVDAVGNVTPDRWIRIGAME